MDDDIKIDSMINEIFEKYSGLNGFLKLKKMSPSSKVFCVVTEEEHWRTFRDEYQRVFGGFGEVRADSFVSVRPLELSEYLRDTFYVNQDSSILIRIQEHCPLALIPVIIHLARKMRFHPDYYDANAYDAPPICIWMTPLAYLNLTEYRFYIMSSLGISNVYYHVDSEYSQTMNMEKQIRSDPRFRNHETVKKLLKLSEELWYDDYLSCVGARFGLTPKNCTSIK